MPSLLHLYIFSFFFSYLLYFVFVECACTYCIDCILNLGELTSPNPESPNPQKGDWGCHYNAVGHHSTHPDQGHGVVLHDKGEGYQPPITSRRGSSQVPQWSL